jgi:hypothetical protein
MEIPSSTACLALSSSISQLANEPKHNETTSEHQTLWFIQDQVNQPVKFGDGTTLTLAFTLVRPNPIHLLQTQSQVVGHPGVKTLLILIANATNLHQSSRGY